MERVGSASYAVPHRPQEEGRKVRMIRRFAIGFACTPRRLGAADRRHRGSGLCGRRRLLPSALCLPRLPFAACVFRFAFPRMMRLPFTAWLAPATRAVTRSFPCAMPARAFVMGGFG